MFSVNQIGQLTLLLLCVSPSLSHLVVGQITFVVVNFLGWKHSSVREQICRQKGERKETAFWVSKRPHIQDRNLCPDGPEPQVTTTTSLFQSNDEEAPLSRARSVMQPLISRPNRISPPMKPPVGTLLDKILILSNDCIAYLVTASRASRRILADMQNKRILILEGVISSLLLSCFPN